MNANELQQAPYPSVDYTATSNPNCGLPRVQLAVGTLMHSTGGRSSRRILQGLDGSQVSVHTLIERDGARDVLYTPDRVCFHAGTTTFYTPPGARCDTANELLLGIEMEALTSEDVTLQQTDSAAEQIALWALTLGWRWPYNLEGHYSIAVPVGRRSDPYRFNWGGFAGRLLYWSRYYSVPGLV